MAGAGLSVSAGIPDFRTPGTGLYDNLEKYKLPFPTAIFELRYFREFPEPFYLLAKEMFPGKWEPTPGHYFVKLLEEKGVLLHAFTQNIDTLERVAGVSDHLLVEVKQERFFFVSCFCFHLDFRHMEVFHPQSALIVESHLQSARLKHCCSSQKLLQ
jgi:NAD-dependent SIR2 family protein deacetylase